MTNNTSEPQHKQLFCFGFGYVAQHLAKALKEADPTWTIVATTTEKEKLAEIKAQGVKAYLFSDKMPFNDPIFTMRGTTHVLISIPPNHEGDIVFKSHARDILQNPNIEWIGYLSSTGVYGNRDGNWVTETSEVRPTSERGSKRAKAEIQWLKMRRIAGIPINIFRLAGIYGPGRSALDSVRAGHTRRINKPDHVFNRIHVDDIVQALIASTDQPKPGDIYNLADDDPAPSHELISYACKLLGKTPPPLLDFNDYDMTPMATSFYRDNKRVSNKKIKEKLGITLKHPDYKSGLDAIFKAE
jgi:nucleoside-diphosphate-sugar epimerase